MKKILYIFLLSSIILSSSAICKNNTKEAIKECNDVYNKYMKLEKPNTKPLLLLDFSLFRFDQIDRID